VDWSTQCQARLFGEWNEDVDTLVAAQREALGRARLLVTAETTGDGPEGRVRLKTVLYMAPVPISKHDDDFGEPSIHNRDRFFESFEIWLNGYRAGRKVREGDST
jgi:hypothetical protein